MSTTARPRRKFYPPVLPSSASIPSGQTPAATAVSPYPTNNVHTCSHSLAVKAARVRGGPVYQFEFVHALENGKLWYNLSNLDGNPFTDVSRELAATRRGCPRLRCEAGNDGSACDYPAQTDCQLVGHIAGWLCKGPRANSALSDEEVEKLRRTALRFEDLETVEA